MDWVLYLGNKTIDPYSWYMNENDFNNFLVKKYSVTTDVLQDKIAFYRNNWYEKEEKISISEYAVLANNVHRYWEPYYNSTVISGYQRVRQDWVINTNSVRRYTANSSSFANFKTNEIVDITFDLSHKGTGQVVIANSSSITLQNIYGTSLANSTVVISGTSYLKGRESSANAKFGTASNHPRCHARNCGHDAPRVEWAEQCQCLLASGRSTQKYLSNPIASSADTTLCKDPEKLEGERHRHSIYNRLLLLKRSAPNGELQRQLCFHQNSIRMEIFKPRHRVT
jgi:hypothetical protein